MKKIRFFLAIVIALFALQTLCFSAEYSKSSMGMKLSLSDDWTVINEDDTSISFGKSETNESIYTICYDFDKKLTDYSDDELQSYCEEIFSNRILANNLVKTSGIWSVYVSTDSVEVKHENHGNKDYFRYEKVYTASARGYNDTKFYITVYLTEANDKLYVMAYQRSMKVNSYLDFLAMLESISFEDGIKIYVDAARVYPDSDPVIVDGRTLVPIRAVAEKMGYTVSWDDSTKTVELMASIGVPTITVKIGDDHIIKNSSISIPLDVQATIIDGRTYLPLRAVASAMNAAVHWNEEDRAVEIHTNML